MELSVQQQALIERMKNEDLVIIDFHNYSENTHDACLSDKDRNNTYFVNVRTFESLAIRGYLKCKSIYSTVQPDTETFEFSVKSEIEKL